jgi:nucleoside-diphosphate-sugar epimerase
MAGDLVFITGGSGHLGYKVIVDALQAGYRVRAAIRNQSKADLILAGPSIKSINPGKNLEFVIVPDIEASNAYDEVVKGASYIIHCASPLASSTPPGADLDKHLVQPAVNATLSILTAAQKEPTIKRVVITSSIVALVGGEQLSAPSTIVTNEKSRAPSTTGPYANGFAAYGASKVKALNEAEAWVKREKPSFDVAYIMPSFITGRNELVTDVKDIYYGSNRKTMGAVTGQDVGPTPNVTVHLKDAALAHVKALDPKVPAQGYLLSSEGDIGGTNWESTWDLVLKNFPDAAKSGLLSRGNVSTVQLPFDERKSEELLGFKFTGFEEQLKDIVSHYIELKQKA